MTNLRVTEYKGVESADGDNSTTSILGIGGVFTGEWEEIKDYASIRINIYADQDAAEMGLDFQQSPDQTIIFDEPYGYDAGTHKLYNINPNAKYFRIVFTNGSVAQTTFNIQTIYGFVFARPTSHRLSDTLSGNDDTDVVKSAISFLNEVDDEYKNVGIQNPFPVDGDSVYAKDVWIAESDIGDFSGSLTDIFDNLHSTIIDSTSNNPKELFIHFNRTIISGVIGLGAFSGDFSNVEIEIYNSGGISTTVVDESANSTKYTSRTFAIAATAGFNALKFTFHTADTVTLSNSVILKTRARVSRIQATSQLDGLVEDITSYRGSLNVNNAWVNRKIVNESFHEHDTAVTNPTTGITEGDTAVTVDSVVGFSVNDVVKIEEDVAGVGIQEIGVLTITIIAGSVLTLDRPISNDYTTAATIERVVINMNVAGTLSSPVIFEIDPPLGTIWQFTRILISMVHTAAGDDGKFGGITALANGVSLRATTAAGRTVTYANWKTNGDMSLDMFDVVYTDKAPAGANGTKGRWTFTKAEVVAEIDGDASPVQKLEVLIQDDLTGLTSFEIKGQGRIFSP